MRPAPAGDPLFTASRGVGAIFLLFGLVIGGWAPHIPLIQARFDLSQTALGVILLTMGIGAILAMSLADGLVARIGSAAATRSLAWLFVISLPIAIAMPQIAPLVLLLALFGGICGCLDVTLNAQALLVEQKAGVPVMSWFHGMFSLGALIGAGAGGPLLVLMPPVLHSATMALVSALILIWAAPRLLAGAEDRGGPVGHFTLPARACVGLGLLTLVSFVAEGAMLDWTGIYILNELESPAMLASAGFAAFSLTMTIGRFMGDRLRRRHPSHRLLIGGFCLAAAGIGLALATQSSLLAILGFGIAGLGLANAVPLLFAAAGRIEGLSPGAGIAGVASIGYAGFLVGPALIGFLADLTSLRLAILALALGCLAGALAIAVQSSRGRKR